MVAKPGICKCSHLCDIISLNRYFGWYVNGGYEMVDGKKAFMEEMADWAKMGKPILMTEYGADTYAGEHKLPSVMWSEDYQMEYLEMQHEVLILLTL